MDGVDPATAYMRPAIDCLAAWMGKDRVRAALHLARLKYCPEGADEDAIMVGLLNLSHSLVLELAKERGAGSAEDLAKKAHEILAELWLKATD